MNKKQNIWVIIPAAGVGARMKNDIPKQYLLLNDVTVIEHTLKIFDSHSSISEIIVAVSKEDEYWSSINISLSKPIHKVTGGKERCDTVLNCLKFLKDKANTNDWVLVHDAARPCLRNDDLSLLLETLDSEEVGGILAVPVRDTMKRSVKRENINLIKETVNRENLWHALTPQMFRFGLLFNALESALNKKELITDEASAVELEGYQPLLVEGHADNLKITRPEDLSLAAFYLRQADLELQRGKTIMRIGQGYDAHKFKADGRLVLAGVDVPYEKGMEAHSDGDVVIHALCDALLGAMALGDIGQHFPDTDDSYKGIDSRILLKEVMDKIREGGMKLGNADITIIAQAPKLAPYIQAMREILAADMATAIQNVSVKATTTEKMGFTGRAEGIAVTAVVLLV